MDVRALGEQIIAARSSGGLLDAPADHRLDAVSAYAVQDMVTDWRIASGARIAGWKLGYTSQAMRKQMGIDQPNVGPLLDTMLLPSGSVIDTGVVQPRVEPEIAAVLARDVDDPANAVAAVGEWRLALEVVDSVWRDYRFDWALNTADGSSAAFVVLGDPVAGDVADLEVELAVGADVAVGRSDAAMGDPRRAVRWLAEQLEGRPRGLRAGDVVITGGLTRAIPLEGIARARAGAAEVCVTG